YPVLRHRIVTTFTADAEGITTDMIVRDLIDAIPLPQEEAAARVRRARTHPRANRPPEPPGPSNQPGRPPPQLAENPHAGTPTMTFRFDPTELNQYGGISLVARSLVEGFLTGVHKSPYKGYSVEFAEHRQYYPGDEIRHIDWRVYGKTDRYYIKEFEEETNLHAHLLVDASGSMAYRGKTISKFQYAQYLAASLAYLMLHQRDAVGLVVHDQ